MQAVFVELPVFAKWRSRYLSDRQFLELQRLLMQNPHAGDVIPGASGVRKMRFADQRRSKGKRGGLRVIYYWWPDGPEFWLFTLFDKDEISNLTPDECKTIGKRVKAEIASRS